MFKRSANYGFVFFLLAACASATADTLFSFPIEGSQGVPPVVTANSGSCTAVLNTAQTQLTVNCTHTIPNIDVTAAHIHNAPPGANGGVVFPFVSGTSPISGIWALSAADVTALLAGNLYVNVHSTAFPAGELRGQITGIVLPATNIPGLGLTGLLLLSLLLPLSVFFYKSRSKNFRDSH